MDDVLLIVAPNSSMATAMARQARDRPDVLVVAPGQALLSYRAHTIVTMRPSKPEHPWRSAWHPSA